MSKDELTMVFKTAIKRLREEKDLTQVQLAEELGISRSALSYYERGERAPDIVILSMFADYFGVSADYLLGRSTVRATKEDIQTACQVTGLSEESIDIIRSCTKKNEKPKEVIGLGENGYTNLENGNVADWCICNLLKRTWNDVQLMLEDMENNQRDGETFPERGVCFYNPNDSLEYRIYKLVNYIKLQLDNLVHFEFYVKDLLAMSDFPLSQEIFTFRAGPEMTVDLSSDTNKPEEGD